MELRLSCTNPSLRSFYFHNRITYTGKTASLYWTGVPVVPLLMLGCSPLLPPQQQSHQMGASPSTHGCSCPSPHPHNKPLPRPSPPSRHSTILGHQQQQINTITTLTLNPNNCYKTFQWILKWISWVANGICWSADWFVMCLLSLVAAVESMWRPGFPPPGAAATLHAGVARVAD